MADPLSIPTGRRRPSAREAGPCSRLPASPGLIHDRPPPSAGHRAAVSSWVLNESPSNQRAAVPPPASSNPTAARQRPPAPLVLRGEAPAAAVRHRLHRAGAGRAQTRRRPTSSPPAARCTYRPYRSPPLALQRPPAPSCAPTAPLPPPRASVPSGSELDPLTATGVPRARRGRPAPLPPPAAPDAALTQSRLPFRRIPQNL
ncbi:lysine-rich arabinogalactan protein 19-like [Ananas comosus]|uniref:Lysine-rich arabinogalactan protein 19-like n=1 Tax=Ananas comosus TaxID=4615 RepID=A0A6P5EAI3_ANACO|nr:lysine-rich arabinogalactan protein 19-like [Ananas comosus]